MMTDFHGSEGSCHIFVPCLWFDSNVVLMPLFVFELARAFQRENFMEMVRLFKLQPSLSDDKFNKAMLDKLDFIFVW